MTPKERKEVKDEAESFSELLSLICKGERGHGSYLKQWVDNLEKFFDNNGFNRSKPRKMAVTYVLTRYGCTAVTVSYWWGETDGTYWSLSEKTAKKYLREIRELINEHPEAETESEWTSGDMVYEPSEHPLKKFYDVKVEKKNSNLSAYC